MENKIRLVVNEVLSAVQNEELKSIIKTKTFVTGGCFKALYHYQEVNDYDFYFIDKESKDKFNTICTPGPEVFTDMTKLRMDLKHKSEFALSFDLKRTDGTTAKIQFITKYVGFPEVVTGNFDFKHTMNYYVPAFDAFKIDVEILKNKKLIFNPKASHPVNALKRLQKFVQQGWTIDDPELMKIAESISKLDLTNDEVYREQASGMYLYKESKMRGYNSRRNIG